HDSHECRKPVAEQPSKSASHHGIPQSVPLQCGLLVIGYWHMPADKLSFRQYVNTAETAFWCFVGIGISGLGLWSSFSENDWTFSFYCSGLGLLLIFAHLSDPWLKENGVALARNLETMGLLPRPSEAYLLVISLAILGLLLFEDIWRDMWWLL